MANNLTQWNANNKNWLKERKRIWSNIQIRLKVMSCIKKSEIKFIRDWYLRGFFTIPKNQYFNDNQSLQELDLPHLLIELWLAPNESTEFSNQVIEKYNTELDIGEARRFFEQYAYSPWLYIKDGKDFFLGSEQRLHKLLYPKHYKQEYYPELSQESFLQFARALKCRIITSTLIYFSHFPPCNNYITKYQTQELIDILHISDSETLNNKTSEYCIKAIDRILLQPDSYPESFVTLARDFFLAFSCDSIPNYIKNKITLLKLLPIPDDEKLIFNALASIYIPCQNNMIATELASMLIPEEREILSQKIEHQSLNHALCDLYRPESINVNDNYILISIKFGPLGDLDIQQIFNAAFISGSDKCYAFFNKQGNPIVFYEYKLGEYEYIDHWEQPYYKYSYIPNKIYEVGQDENFDIYLNENFDNYDDAIPEVVKRYAK